MRAIFTLVVVIASCVSETPRPTTANVAACRVLYCKQGYHANYNGCGCVPD